MSGIPKPKVGDELIIYHPKSRRLPEQTVPVRVTAVARFRATLEAADGEALPWYLAEFDIRSGRSWSNRDWTNSELHTAETLRLQKRMQAAESYLVESGVWLHSLRGPLAKAAREDPLGFTNALRRFEGLEGL